ncbi:MAG: adenylate kinase [bacterium]|nr:adenylate kinase [bacterium]
MQVQALNTMPNYGINFQHKSITKPVTTKIVKNVGCDSVSFTNSAKNYAKKVIIMLGAPNSGKGTYSRQISAKYSIPQISTGDILRNEVKQGTELGKKAQDYMSAGGLVPDDLILDIFKSRIKMPDCARGFILDGFPRTVKQAEKLDKLLKEDKNIDVRIINLDVDENILFERSAKRYMCKNCSRTYSLEKYNPEISKCECGGQLIKRADDKPEVLAKRLVSYKDQSLPLIDFYSDKVENIAVHDNNIILETFMEKIYSILDSSK